MAEPRSDTRHVSATGNREHDQNLPGMGGVFSPRNLGLYSYAHLNPVRLMDPDGKETVGEIIDRKAMEAASGGNDAATYGWAFAATAWTYLGAESVSTIADGGKITLGVAIGAVIEVAQLKKGKAAVEAVVLTKETASKLGKELIREAKELRPVIEGVGAEAHHIVAKGSKYAALARGKLEEFGVNINSAANGIWVDAKKHASMHTKEYYQKIDSFFENVATKPEAEKALKAAKEWVKSIIE